MKIPVLPILGVSILLSQTIDGNHFLGGTITWRPLNQSATGSPVAIVITQTYSFNYTIMQCSNAMIMSNSLVPNYMGLASEKLDCVANCITGSVGYTSINIIPRCTDFSIPGVTTVGQRSDIVYLQSGSDFSASFTSIYWRPLTTVASGAWSLSTRIKINLRLDNGLYNNAPVTTMMSPINLPVNKTVAIHIPVADADGDTVRCRWANKSNGVDECNTVCPPGSLPPNTVLFPNCTIIITGGNIDDVYAVAVMMEDFLNSSNTTTLSSVPVQFLVQVVNVSSCTTPPEVVGGPPADSCTPVIVGQTYEFELIAINHCGANVSIDDIATLSFAGVIRSNITAQNSVIYHKTFSWTPTATQLGYQVMCAMAVDSQYTQSAQYCFNFYVSMNVLTDCPGKITLTTTTTTTSSTTTSSTTSSTSATTTTSITTRSTSTTTSRTSTTNTDSKTSTTSSTTSITTRTTSSSTITSTTSPSTTTGNTTNSSAVITASTTISPAKENNFNWTIFGIVMGLTFFIVLLLCWYFCGLYICPSIDYIPRHATDDQPVLYSIEQSVDFDCSWSDTFESLDTSIGPYMNMDRSSSDNASIMAMRDFDNGGCSIVPPNQDPNVPLVHVFLPRLRTLRSEQNLTTHRLKPQALVRVSRNRPATHEVHAYVHTAPEKVRVTRVNEPGFSREGYRIVQSISSLPSISSRTRVERKRRIVIRNLLPSFITKQYQRK